MKRFLLSTFFPNSIPRILIAPTSSSKQPAVILILGWGGATQKNLKKVVSYYEEKGINSVTMVAPLFVPLCIESFFEKEATKLLLQQNKKTPPPKFYCHLFSNNGSWSYHNFMNRIKFAKVIMDSGPAAHYDNKSINDEAQALSRVFTSIILKKNIYSHAIISPILHTILLPYIVFIRAILDLQDRISVPLFPNYLQRNIALRDASPVCPHLFICSTGDTILENPHTVAERVEVYGGYIKKRGIPTAIHVFGNDVPHTSSFYLYNEEYRKLLDGFLE